MKELYLPVSGRTEGEGFSIGIDRGIRGAWYGGFNAEFVFPMFGLFGQARLLSLITSLWPDVLLLLLHVANLQLRSTVKVQLQSDRYSIAPASSSRKLVKQT